MMATDTSPGRCVFCGLPFDDHTLKGPRPDCPKPKDSK